MDLQLQGKVTVVTGASAGIGRGIALMLAQEGAQTVVVARRRELLNELAVEIVGEGGRAPLILEADLAAAGNYEAITGGILREFGKADVVVNSAGGSRPLSINATD